MTELEYLEKVIKEKTPGPWSVDEYLIYKDSGVEVWESPSEDIVINDDMCSAEDRRFIATMGTIAPLLLDVVKAADAVADGIANHKSEMALEEAIEALKNALREVMK